MSSDDRDKYPIRSVPARWPPKRMTQATVDRLRALGQPPAGCVEIRDPTPDDILMCERFSVAEGLMLPDNAIGKCGACGYPIQFGLETAQFVRKLCIECTAQLVNAAGMAPAGGR